MARVSTAEMKWVHFIGSFSWLIVGLGQVLDGNEAAGFAAFILSYLIADQ